MRSDIAEPVVVVVVVVKRGETNKREREREKRQRTGQHARLESKDGHFTIHCQNAMRFLSCSGSNVVLQRVSPPLQFPLSWLTLQQRWPRNSFPHRYDRCFIPCLFVSLLAVSPLSEQRRHHRHCHHVSKSVCRSFAQPPMYLSAVPSMFHKNTKRSISP